MLATKANIHRSKLPAPGAVGYLTGGRNRLGEVLYLHGRRERVIAESFNVTDSADPRYSRGIHLATFRYLGRGDRVTVSGFYFTPEEEV